MSYLAAFLFGTVLFFAGRFFPFSGVLISLVTAVSLVRRRASPLVFCAVFTFFCLLGFYHAKLAYVPTQSASDIAGEVVEFRGIARSEAVRPDPASDVFSQTVEVADAKDGRGQPVNLEEMRILTNAPLSPGRQYLVRAKVPASACTLNPGGYRGTLPGYLEEASEVAGYSGEPAGVPAVCKSFRDLRLQLNRGIKERFSGETAPFLMSIITGERGLLTREMNNAFNATGLAHILSISGSNFGLLLVVLFGIIKGLVKLLPYRFLSRLTLYVTPTQAAAFLCIPFMAGYLGISDMSAPAVRSFIMILFFLSGLLVQRRGFWLNTLLFAAALITAARPDAVLELSFQLSFVAVLCIGLVTERRDRTGSAPPLPRFLSSSLRYIRASMLISLAATAGTAPLVVYYFHSFSLVSPFTNLVITPVIGIVILPAALFSSFVFLLSGSFPLCSLIDGFTAFILASIRQIARWNFAAVRIPAFPPLLLITFYAGLLLFVILKGGNVLSATRNESKEKEDSKNSSLITRHASRFLLPFSIAVIPFLIYAGFRMIGHKGLRVTYLDVGQGDAAVAELPDGRVLALDTGRNGSQTAAFLRYRGVGAIGALVLSHGQSDHSGGVGYLRDNFIINGIWDNNRLVYPRDLVRGIPHRGLERGDIIRGDGYVIEALHPYTGFYMSGPKDADENNDSLVLRIRGKKAAFLFTGDIEQTGAEDIAHLGAYLKSTVLKVPHHGSRSSLSEPFLKMVAPEAAVISVGRENPFGHPHDEVIEALRGTRIFRTDRDGAIGIRECPDGSLEIKTWRDFQFSEAGTLNDEFMNLKRLFWVW